VELFTLDRKFLKTFEIDKFTSAIWTERYYGDSEVELVVPATLEMIQQLPIGTFLGLVGSKEIMMIDTSDNEKGQLKVTGQSLLPWMNNRFIRVDALHETRYWNIVGVPGWALWAILYYMCVSGTYPLGVPNPAQFVIPGLGLKGYDTSGASTNFAVPYGPVYDAMRDIATTYEIGMTITLESASSTGYSLQFLSYKGLDHTSGQNVNPIVRFSPQMDTLTDIKELQSIASYKTLVYSFCPPNPDGIADTIPAGVASVVGPTGFDLRALMTFEEDITTDMVGGNAATLQSLLNTRANMALQSNRFIKAVDGTIVPLHQFQYGVDYNIGDIIEVQGNSAVISSSRVTEYIRAQDSAGERAYPTVAMLS
jgi:hypothetical protein